MKNKFNHELAVCGFAAVKALAKMHANSITRLYFTAERAAEFGELCRSMAARRAPYNMVQDPIELEKLCGSVHHQGVVAMIAQPEIPLLNTSTVDQWVRQKQDALLLDRVGNANNLGAIIRSAAFFGVQNIIIPLSEAQSSITTSSYRVAQGGMEYVHIYSVKSIARLLAAVQGRMARIGTDLQATTPASQIREKCNGKPALLILGNEEKGISAEVKRNCDELVIIPFAGMESGLSDAPVESLNVAQASAVLLYECRKN